MVITNAWAEDPLLERRQSQLLRYRLNDDKEETLALTARLYPITGSDKGSLEGLWKAAKQLNDSTAFEKKAARSQLRDWLEQAHVGRLWAREAFHDIEVDTRWQQQVTRVRNGAAKLGCRCHGYSVHSFICFRLV